MREAEAVAGRLQEPGGRGRMQGRLVGSRRERALERRLRHQGHEAHRLEGGGVDLRQALLHELGHGVGDRQPSGAEVREPAALEGPGDLQGHERVAARGGLDPPQRRMGERHPEPVPQHAVKGADAQAADRHDLDRQAGTVEAQRRAAAAVRALGADEADRLAVEPAGGEAERVCARAVQPLNVVDSDEDWSVRGQGEQGGAQGGRDDVGLRGPLGRILEHEGHGERSPLGHRQAVEDLLRASSQQVSQGGERQAGLGLGRPGLEHRPPALPDLPHGEVEERRLPGPGLSGEHERTGPRRDSVDEPSNPVELVLASDDLVEHGARLHLAPCPFCELYSRSTAYFTQTA